MPAPFEPPLHRHAFGRLCLFLHSSFSLLHSLWPLTSHPPPSSQPIPADRAPVPPEPRRSTPNPQITTNMLLLIPTMGKRAVGCAERPLFPAESGNKLISDRESEVLRRDYGEATVRPARVPGAVSHRVVGSLIIVIWQPHHQVLSTSHWYPGYLPWPKILGDSMAPNRR